jgi:hypothetical protein
MSKVMKIRSAVLEMLHGRSSAGVHADDYVVSGAQFVLH